MNGTSLAAGTVAGEGSFYGGWGTRSEVGVGENLVEVGWSVQVDIGGYQIISDFITIIT